MALSMTSQPITSDVIMNVFGSRVTRLELLLHETGLGHTEPGAEGSPFKYNKSTILGILS